MIAGEDDDEHLRRRVLGKTMRFAIDAGEREVRGGGSEGEGRMRLVGKGEGRNQQKGG
jgi:hypothetical protein